MHSSAAHRPNVKYELAIEDSFSILSMLYDSIFGNHVEQ